MNNKEEVERAASDKRKVCAVLAKGTYLSHNEGLLVVNLIISCHQKGTVKSSKFSPSFRFHGDSVVAVVVAGFVR